jgi:alpha-tubulin suppressor-like RCC1 family protein
VYRYSGEAYVWGYGDLGQLGRGEDQSDAMTPERINPVGLYKCNRRAWGYFYV